MPNSPLISFPTFGETLRYLRRRAGLTQRQLSIAVGFSDSQISRLEQNERQIDAATLLALFVPALELEDQPEVIDHLLKLVAAPPIAGQDLAKAEARQPLEVTPLSNLSARLSSFVGREAEIEALREGIFQNRLATLTGVGGVGKTSLAQSVASQILSHFVDGVWWVELAPLLTAALVPQTVAATFKIALQSEWTYLEALAGYCQKRHLLLILDNCEHLIDACANLVTFLLQNCPHLHILVTSRERLSIEGEVEWPVLPLTAPRHLSESDAITAEAAMRRFEAVRLFVERARTTQPAFVWSDQYAASVCSICSRLDGLPLAIELAAARLRGMAVDELANRLNDRFRLLSATRRATTPRHQTLRAAVDWSYDLLTEDERALLRRLSVFVGGWNLDGVEAIAALQTPKVQPIDNPIDLLLQLVNKSLVVVEPRGHETRYRMLETIRQYAAEKLKEMGETDLVQSGHFAFFLALAEQSGDLRFAWRHDLLIPIEREQANLRAALNWSKQHTDDGERFLQLVVALWPFWSKHGSDREGQEWLTEALARGDKAPPRLRATAMYALADLQLSAYVHEQRMALVKDALDLCQQENDLQGMAYCHYLLGESAIEHSDFPQALSNYELALPYLRSTKQTMIAGYCLRGMAAIYRHTGNSDLAIPLIEECLALAHQSDAKRLLPTALQGLFEIDAKRGKELCEQELTRLRRLNDHEILAPLLQMYSCALILTGDGQELDRGIQLLTECLELWHKLGIKWSVEGGIGRANLYLGHAYARKDEHSLAIAHAREALSLYEEVGDIAGVGWAYTSIGWSALAMNDLSQAYQSFRDSLMLSPDGSMFNVPHTLLGLAETIRRQGDLVGAGHLFGSLVLYQENPDVRDVNHTPIKHLPAMQAAYTYLDDPAFAAAWAIGEQWSLATAITNVLT